eukprot:XP_014775096.1 PREDICTED: uncharacterized protein LOC106872576 [Octopus bimaculoides]
MEKYLKPNRLNANPNSTNIDKTFNYWFRTFTNFIDSLPGQEGRIIDKLNLLTKYVEPNVYEYISEVKNYEQAVNTLKSVYIKLKNIIMTCHLLATRKQKPGESLDQYLNELKILAKDCDFVAVNAEQYRSEMIRDAFINVLILNQIRQRLLESKSVDLNTAYDQARLLDVAQQSSSVFSNSECANFSPTAPIVAKPIDSPKLEEEHSAVIQKGKPSQCWFCGYSRHLQSCCPVQKAVCHKCQKIGHFGKLCRSNVTTVTHEDDKYDLRLTVSASVGSPFRVNSLVILNNTYKAKILGT